MASTSTPISGSDQSPKLPRHDDLDDQHPITIAEAPEGSDTVILMQRSAFHGEHAVYKDKQGVYYLRPLGKRPKSIPDAKDLADVFNHHF